MSDKAKFEAFGVKFEAEGKSGVIAASLLFGLLFTTVLALGAFGIKAF